MPVRNTTPKIKVYQKPTKFIHIFESVRTDEKLEFALWLETILIKFNQIKYQKEAQEIYDMISEKQSELFIEVGCYHRAKIERNKCQ